MLGREEEHQGRQLGGDTPCGLQTPIPLPLQGPRLTALLVDSTEGNSPSPSMPGFTENGVLFSAAQA